VVAGWISVLCFGSSVAPQLFGVGNKLLHNVIGGFGVLKGNGGNLRALFDSLWLHLFFLVEQRRMARHYPGGLAGRMPTGCCGVPVASPMQLVRRHRHFDRNHHFH